MTSIEAKREQFRKYLERCGLIDSLSKALIKLYEEQNKPDDCIRFVRKYMCETCPDDDAHEKMKHNFEEAKRKIAELEEELEKFRADVTRSPSEILSYLENGFQGLQDDETTKPSLLKKYLTLEIFEHLKNEKTSSGATLLDCIQSGLKYHNSSVGIYAADLECYDHFHKLFDPIILEYHGLEGTTEAKLQKDVDWGTITDIKDLDPDGKYIISTRIRTARNLDGFPYFPKLTQEQFAEIEDQVKSATLELKDDLKGEYSSLKEIDLITQEEMVNRHILFKKGDAFLAEAGAYRYWPTGRGIFKTPSENFLIWVNEEDHMRIISMTKGGDLGNVYKRLVEAIGVLQEHLKFVRHQRFGNVSACPSNLGTTMRAGVHIKLPNLSKDSEKLNELADQLNLQIRGTGGEHTEIEEGVMDISNKRRLGLTEYEVVKSLQDGIQKLIQVEEESVE